MKAVIYTRVSTQGQDYQRQINDLHAMADRNGYEIVKEFSEKISGAKLNADRDALVSMVKFATDPKNGVSVVIVSEISRIGRNVAQLLQTIETLHKAGVAVAMLDNGMVTLDKEGKENPYFKMVLTVLASVAELERTQIRERMASGYKNYVEAGGKVGRKVGKRIYTDSDLLQKYAPAVRDLEKGMAIRKVMKVHGLSSGTVQKLKKLVA